MEFFPTNLIKKKKRSVIKEHFQKVIKIIQAATNLAFSSECITFK
jgi:hypothetical protein